MRALPLSPLTRRMTVRIAPYRTGIAHAVAMPAAAAPVDARSNGGAGHARTAPAALLYVACVLLGVVAACLVRDGGRLAGVTRSTAASVVSSLRTTSRARLVRGGGTVHAALVSPSLQKDALRSAALATNAMSGGGRRARGERPREHESDTLFEDFEPSFRVAP